jgi:hypothetical protein
MQVLQMAEGDATYGDWGCFQSCSVLLLAKLVPTVLCFAASGIGILDFFCYGQQRFATYLYLYCYNRFVVLL